MRSYLAAFLMALTVAALLTPVMRLLARRLGAFSEMGGRHVHAEHVPRLGGVGIAIATLSPLVTLFVVDSEVARTIRERPDMAFTLVLGSLFLCFIGALDDTRGLGPIPKLIAQIIAALGAYVLGFRIDGISMPLLGPVSMGAFAPLVTVVWIVGITNAVNLIDGLDGLAAGVVFFAAATNFVVALVSGHFLGTVFVCLLMASLMGALLGFLFYNFNPARIFMGDSGSYFLGYLLAVTALMAPMQTASTTVSLAVPILALGLPIFDTLFSIGRRYFERRPIFAADRGHIHHRLLDMGITHRRAVMTLYGVTIALAAAATGVALGQDWQAGMAVVGASVVLIGLVRFVGYFNRNHIRFRRSHLLYDQLTQALRRDVPRLVIELVEVRTVAQLRATLEQTLAEPYLRSLRVLDGAGKPELQLFERNSSPSDAVDVNLPLLGMAKELQISLSARRPGTEAVVLLQLLADAIAASLLRCASRSPAPAATSQEQKVLARA